MRGMLGLAGLLGAAVALAQGGGPNPASVREGAGARQTIPPAPRPPGTGQRAVALPAGGLADRIPVPDLPDNMNLLVAYGSEVPPNDGYWAIALAWRPQVANDPTGWARRHFCGGVLLTANWVLTAAHCVEGVDKARLIVRAGTHDIAAAGGQWRDVAEIVPHPGFAPGSEVPPVAHRHDLALLRLSAPLTLGSGAKTSAIMLAPAGANRTRARRAALYGWGRSVPPFDADSTSAMLRYAKLWLVPRSECNTDYAAQGQPGDPPTVGPDTLCAAGTIQPNGAVTGKCWGDSGGPLVVRANDRPRLIGIASWGAIPCDVSGFPGTYASVAAARAWIGSVIATP